VPGPRVVTVLTIYSRPGCHLCDDMKAIVRRAVGAAAGEVTIETIDISGRPELEALYGLEIPVLTIDGKKVAKYRVTEAEVRRMLAARDLGAGKAGGAG
jgi:glutaredoxin